MAGAELPEDYQNIDRLIESGDLDGARNALQQVSREHSGIAVLRLKLALRDNALSPSTAMQKLVQIMRDNPDAPGAQDLYREASGQSYQTHISSPAHSHPRMPAVRVNDEPDE